MDLGAGAHPAVLWRELLRGLYDGPQTSLLLEQIPILLEKHRSSLPQNAKTERILTEGDAILITYPDQVRQAGHPPLAVLSEFCRNRLEGLITIVHVLPFYPSSSDDGFSVADYLQVDPALGAWTDIHRLGEHFRLMMDAVMNHVSVRHPWFQGFLREEERYRDYFIEMEDSPLLGRVIRPRTTPLLHRFEGATKEKTVWTTFSADQVDLNYRNPRVLLEMIDLLLFYAGRGAAILRLDAAAYLWKETGTACINLPQAHRIVRLLRAAIGEIAPGVMLVTETNVPQDENISYFGDGRNEAHLVYNFALPPLVLHTLLTGDARRLSGWVDALPHPGSRSAYLNFLASHDGIGLNAAREILPAEDVRRLIHETLDHGGLVSDRRNPNNTVEPYELNINYFDALSDPNRHESLDIGIRRFLAAHGILLSLAGIPAIYFHSLFGSRGWREGAEQTGRKRTINRRKYDRSELEAELEDEAGLRGRVFSGLADQLRARRKSPAFDPYGMQKTVDFGEAVFALLRTHPETGRRVLCLQEVSGRPQTIALDPEAVFGGSGSARALIDLISGRRFSPQRMNSVSLDAYQTRWLSPRSGDPPPAKERIHPV